MTGLHALHMIIGIGLVTWILIAGLWAHSVRRTTVPVENVGLYWHFVDLVWIYLIPAALFDQQETRRLTMKHGESIHRTPRNISVTSYRPSACTWESGLR